MPVGEGRTGEQGERQNSINSNRECPEKKYIHIVNNIVCVFQMSIIMQILSMYVITDKQKDVSHDVIMVKCYKFCYYLYVHRARGILLLPILPNFHYYAYYYKLQANIR